MFLNRIDFSKKAILKHFKKEYIDFFSVGASSYISRGIGLIISIILARWLGPKEYGIYSLGFYIMMITISNGFAGIDQAFIYLFNKHVEIRDTIETNFVFLKFLITLIIIFIIFILFVFSKYINILYIKNINIILIALIGGVGNLLFTITSSNYQANGNFIKYSKTQILFSTLNLICVLIGVIFKIRLIGYFLFIYNISGIIIMFVYKNVKFKIIEIDKDILKKFVHVGKWLVAYSLLRVLNSRLDFFILMKYVNNETLGVYSAALRISNLLLILTGAFAIILLPKATKIRNQKDLKRFWNTYRKILPLLVTILVIVYIIAPFLILLLYGNKYINSILIFKLLLIANLPVIFQLPFKNLFISFDNSHSLFILSLIETIIIFSFVVLTINRIGIIAPPISKIIAYSVSLIGYIIIYIIKKPYYFKKYSIFK